MESESELLTDLLILVILIGLNAFFAASEMALISINDNKYRFLAESGDKKAIQVVKLLSDPSNYLATIQIGITLAGFLASAFASEKFADVLVDLVAKTGIPVSLKLLKNLAVVVITIILSYFTLVFGELVPKRLAMKKAESIANLVVKPLNLLSFLTLPFVRFLSFSTNSIVRLFNIDPHEDDEHITEEEIRMMVDVGEEKGTIDGSEKEMINNIFEFDNKTVTDIMTHRTDIVAIPIDANLNEIITLISEEQFTRIPVYEESIDNIIGILHSKELIKYAKDGIEKSSFDLSSIIRSPYYVPSSKKTDELFRELQASKTHMAVIIDEYGGTAGIVTLEDLVEEIVGNIFDEYDIEEKEYEKLDETTYLVNGSMVLDEVMEFLKTQLPVDEYETLSGFIIGQLGRIPKNEEKPEIEFNGLIFRVVEVDEKRITKVKVCKAM